MLTDAELDKSINRLFDKGSTTIEAAIDISNLVVAIDLEPDVEPDIEPSQLQARERDRLSVGNNSEDSANRSRIDSLSDVETEDETLLTTTTRYSIPKPSYTSELFVSQATVLKHFQAYGRRYSVVQILNSGKKKDNSVVYRVPIKYAKGNRKNKLVKS